MAKEVSFNKNSIVLCMLFFFLIVVKRVLNLYTLLPLIFEEKLGAIWTLPGEGEILPLQPREQLLPGIGASEMAVV